MATASMERPRLQRGTRKPRITTKTIIAMSPEDRDAYIQKQVQALERKRLRAEKIRYNKERRSETVSMMQARLKDEGRSERFIAYRTKQKEDAPERRRAKAAAADASS